MAAKSKEPPVRRFVRTTTPISIVDAMDHAGLFKQFFTGRSWDGWRAILKAAFCLPMTAEEIAFFKQVAGDRDPPNKRVREFWIIAGRRAGKDSIASLIATYAAVFFNAGVDKLRPGERALVQCLAVDRDQAKVVAGYIRSYFDFIPPLRNMVRRRTQNGLFLENDVECVVATNSFRAVRGRAVLLSIFDEVAFWQDERSARPDAETYRAVLPSLATLPGSMLVGITSPYRKAGLAYDKVRKHYGADDDDVLVIKAPSIVLNPTLDQGIIDKALEDDPAAARSEWLGEFRDDISTFVDPEIVEACVAKDVRELPPVRGIRYWAFVDPSGGSSDSMTMAIAHRAGDKAVIDCVRERRPPFSPDSVVIEFAGVLKSYGIGSVHGDRYGGEWPRERFSVHGIRYEPAEQVKSDLYLSLLPLLNSKRVELLDHPRLVHQLCGLERRTARSGRDTVDHGPGAHDDLVNSIAGAAALALGHQGVKVTADLLSRTVMMPRTRQYGSRYSRNIAGLLPGMSAPPLERQCMPASALPAEKLQPQEGER